jgi:hypothetical protein
MTKYDIPQQQVSAMPPGANSPQQAAAMRTQQANSDQAAANRALAGGSKKGGSISVPPPKVGYAETSSGSNSVNSQTQANISASVQNQENMSADKGAFKGGRRHNKSRKTSKRKTKRYNKKRKTQKRRYRK